MNGNGRYVGVLIVLMLCIAAYLTLTTGPMTWNLVIEGAFLRITGATTAWNPLLDERIPRLVVLLSTGASLAVAGAVIQSLFQNPLAGPGLLGLTAGSSLATIIVMLVGGWHLSMRWTLPIASVAGAIVVLGLLVACWRGGRRSIGDLLLLGIGISTLLFAVQQSLLYAFRDQWQLLQSVAEWEAGSSLNRGWHHVHMQLPLAIVGLLTSWYHRHELDLLALGDEEAHTLGVDVAALRWRLILAVGLLVGGATAALGAVPFFGLLLPLLLRRCYGASHRKLLPLCIGIGAVALALGDALLRSSGLYMLTLGNITALLGSFCFLLLLRHPPLSHSHSHS